MELMVVAAVVTTWITCGAFAYARIFAEFQRRWPLTATAQYNSDRRFALRIALFGPAGLIASFLTCSNGLKWR